MVFSLSVFVVTACFNCKRRLIIPITFLIKSLYKTDLHWLLRHNTFTVHNGATGITIHIKRGKGYFKLHRYAVG